MTSENRLGIGGNNPPEMEKIIHDQMQEENAEYLQLMDSVMAKADALPKQVTNDDESGQVTDWVKKAKNVKTTLDAIRKKEKEVWSAKANAVHAFFKKRLDTIDSAIAPIADMNTRYLQEKKDAEDRARAEKHRIAAEEAAEKLKVAQEAERVANEAKEAAEREAARIQKEKDEAEKAAQAEAQRVKEAAEAEANRIAAEAAKKLKDAEEEIARLNKEAADREEAAKQKVFQDEADAAAEAKAKEDLRIAEENRKNASKEVKTATKEGNEILRQADRDVREINKELREEHNAADAELKVVNADVKAANKEVNASTDAWLRSEKCADKAERQTLAGAAELSRTRGSNSLSSLSEKWMGECADRDALFASAREIWDHIPMSALNQAVQAWVNANETNRVLPGAIIWQEAKSNIR